MGCCAASKPADEEPGRSAGAPHEALIPPETTEGDFPSCSSSFDCMSEWVASDFHRFHWNPPNPGPRKRVNLQQSKLGDFHFHDHPAQTAASKAVM